jgi:hypothetical protein
MFCHFNSSRAIALLQLGRRKAHARSLLDGSSYPSLFNCRTDHTSGQRKSAVKISTNVGVDQYIRVFLSFMWVSDLNCRERKTHRGV